MAKNRNDTKNKRIEKKKKIDIVEPVVVDQSDKKMEGDDSKDNEYDSLDDLLPRLFADDDNVFKIDAINLDIKRRVRATRAKVKGKKVISPIEVRKLFLQEKIKEFS